MDLHAREKKRSYKKLVLVIFIRLWTNLFVIMALVGAGAAIYYSANYEFEIVRLMSIVCYMCLLVFNRAHLEWTSHF